MHGGVAASVTCTTSGFPLPPELTYSHLKFLRSNKQAIRCIRCGLLAEARHFAKLGTRANPWVCFSIVLSRLSKRRRVFRVRLRLRWLQDRVRGRRGEELGSTVRAICPRDGGGGMSIVDHRSRRGSLWRANKDHQLFLDSGIPARCAQKADSASIGRGPGLALGYARWSVSTGRQTWPR
jgi:hypothetical protein